MTSNYNPDPEALPDPLWQTVYLSHRDVSSKVPINFVTTPAISLSAACFRRGRYSGNDAIKCLSNLLGAGFQRIAIDVYWDDPRRAWTLCPIAAPSSTSNGTAASPSAASRTSTSASAQVTGDAASSSSPQSVDPSANVESSAVESSSDRTLSRRQQAEDPSSTSSAAISTSSDVPQYSFESYTCTANIDLAILRDVLYDFVFRSATTVDAHLLYVTLHLHLALNSSNSSNPLPTPKNLLGAPTLGNFFQESFSDYLYLPSQLEADRRDLNASWYSVSEKYQPDHSYFNENIDQDGIHSTSDGWPCEAFVEVSRGRRLFLSWGSIDPKMQDYNARADESIIFATDYLDNVQNVTASSSGDVRTGCLFDSDIRELAKSNSSWAVSGDVDGFDFAENESTSSNSSLDLISNLVACGISPMINETLQNSTALENLTLYAEVVHSAIWSWAPGEPRKSPGPGTGSPSSSDFRCAVMDTTLDGRWRVESCSQRHYAACQVTRQPYTFSISTAPTIYTESASSCPPNTTLAVPRTALENAHLHSLAQSDTDRSTGGIWLNFNSIDVEACWVTGVNATCPYYVDESEARQKNVIIPTVAAIIVLVLTGLTLFVKCNANRRGSRRRRRRGDGGWDYEGCVHRTTSLASIDVREYLLTIHFHLVAFLRETHPPARTTPFPCVKRKSALRREAARVTCRAAL
ncbi:MAG: hypothetical protein M1833_000517 [Piccolia ochrophora]|nr:MAG: hypothetical protein M1833_000517 [Piccolia ochrophora]